MLELYKFNVTPALIDIYLKLIPHAFLNKLHIPLFIQQFYVPIEDSIDGDGDDIWTEDNVGGEEVIDEEIEGNQVEEEDIQIVEDRGDEDNVRNEMYLRTKEEQKSHKGKTLKDAQYTLNHSSNQSPKREPIQNLKSTKQKLNSSQSQNANRLRNSKKKILYYRLLRFVLGFIYQYTIYDDSIRKKRGFQSSYYMNDFFDSPEDEFLDEMDFYEILRDERVQKESKYLKQREDENASKSISTPISIVNNSTIESDKSTKKDKSNVTYLRVKTSNDQIMELQKDSFQKFGSKDVHILKRKKLESQLIRFSQMLRVFNSIRGVLKFYLNFSSEEGFGVLLMNYLDMIFLDKKYKVAISSRLKGGNIFFKVLIRRAVQIFGKQFYYSISGWNLWQIFVQLLTELYIHFKEKYIRYQITRNIEYPNEMKNAQKLPKIEPTLSSNDENVSRSFEVSSSKSTFPQMNESLQPDAISPRLSERLTRVLRSLNLAHSISYKNFRARIKTFSNNLTKITLTKQGWQKTPLSRDYIISRWKFYNEKFEREFSTAYERELYYYNDNWIELWKWIQLLLYAFLQSMKVLRHLITIQLQSFKKELGKSIGKIKSFLLMQYFEQLFALSSGYYYKISTEFSWQVLSDNSTRFGCRIPLEWHWGCDLFRIWISISCASEYLRANETKQLQDLICENSRPFSYPIVLPSQEKAISALSAVHLPFMDSLKLEYEDELLQNENNPCISIGNQEHRIEDPSESKPIKEYIKENDIQKLKKHEDIEEKTQIHLQDTYSNLDVQATFHNHQLLSQSSKWHHSNNISIAITMFDLFTIFAYTFTFHTLYRKGKEGLWKIHQLFQSLIDMVGDFIAKHPESNY